MASSYDKDVVFGSDEFVADEILARLPARSAVRCSVLSKRFRQLLASPHFWLRHRLLGPPPEPPHVARLFGHEYGMAFDFHVAGPTFAMKHTVDVDPDGGSYAGTCNGLVLVSSGVDVVLFNPATKEEARLSLPLPPPQNKHVCRRIMGFGCGASSKVYKALIHEADEDCCIRLMVVSLDGSDGHEPRTVFSWDDDMVCRHSLHTADGKVYFLIYTMKFFDEAMICHDWFVTMVLAFNVDTEVATSIALPEGEDLAIDFIMLEIHGRPCIYEQDGQDTVIWLLTPDHRWEQLYILVNEMFQDYDHIEGAWDCGGGLLFTVFKTSGAHLYKLHEPTAEDEEAGGNWLAALSSLTIEYELPEHFKGAQCDEPSNLLDYRPTLISPASILGDAALSSRPRECVVRKHELDGLFLEITQKRFIGPAMQMLTNLKQVGLLDSIKMLDLSKTSKKKDCLIDLSHRDDKDSILKFCSEL